MNAKWLVERLRATAIQLGLSEGGVALEALANEIEHETDRLNRADYERMTNGPVSDKTWERMRVAYD